MSGEEKSLSYKDSGVNIDEGNRFVSKIKDLKGNEKSPYQLNGIGGFGGLFDLGKMSLNHPVLVTSIDGVGTKLAVAKKMNFHKSVGEDIVNHCVNDILVQGAKPLFFSDYIGCGALDADAMSEVMEGMMKACQENNCLLIGGETAEMPGLYGDGDYDLVGSITGVVEKEDVLTGQDITPGDLLISMPSSGLHTNGYSLARKIVFDLKGMAPEDQVDELGQSIGKALLVPHRSYLVEVMDFLKEIKLKGMAHITGGGITENLPRILPDQVAALVDREKIVVPPLFQLLQKWGNVDQEEMYRVFNMGVGLIMVVAKSEGEKLLEKAKQYYPESAIIGEIIESKQKEVLYKN